MVTGQITLQLKSECKDEVVQPVTFSDKLINHAGLFRTVMPCLADQNVTEIRLHTRFESRCRDIESIMSFVEHVLHKTSLVPPEELSEILLIIHESVSNAVYHGNLKVPETVRIQKSFPEYEAELDRDAPHLLGRTVDLTLSINTEHADVTVSDCGGGFDYETEMSRLHPPEPERETGRGIFLLKQTVDEITFHDNGETLHLKKYWRHHA